MANIKTIVLSGAEEAVELNGTNCDIRNDGADTVYASANAGVTAGADGVLSIPAGGAAKLLDCEGTVYLLGTGSVMLCGNDYAESVFKSAATSSGGGGTSSGVSQTYVDEQDSNTLAEANDYTDLAIEQKLIVGTDAASLDNCPEGCWYGQYST